MKHSDSGKSRKYRAANGCGAGNRPKGLTENGSEGCQKGSAEAEPGGKPKEEAGSGTRAGFKGRNKKIILNSKIKDSGSKLIFDNNILCSQFLRDYSNEELMAKKDEISLVMIINKMQTEEDINAFRKLPEDRINAMLQDTPRYLVELIADILMTFLLKVNVPVPEAEELTEKVREKKMGQLFENMDKIDIQAERRKTEKQRKKAEAERRRTEAERQRADRAEREALDAGVKSLVESYQELGAAKKSALNRLMEKYRMDQRQASEKISLYWKK